MSITNIGGLAGEAEILGEIRRFSFDSGQELLVIQGISTLDQALAVLEQLSLGSIKVNSERIRDLKKTKTKSAVEPPAGATAPQSVVTHYADPTPAPAAVVEAPAEPLVPSVAELTPAEAATAFAASVAAAAIAFPTTTGAIAQQVTISSQQTIGEELEAEKPPEAFPEDVLRATKLLPIVTYFRNERGLRGIDAITQACEEARTKIPILAKVKEMRNRVESALLTYFKDDLA